MKSKAPNTDNCYSTKFKMKMDKTYQEIANEFGVSYQAIQLTENKALEKFKRRFCKMYPDTVPLIINDINSGYL